MQEEYVATAADMEALGRGLAAKVSGGDVLLLRGELGAGKSVLVRGLAAGLGAGAWRGSPTFNLVHEYATQPHLYHADLYRLEPNAVEELGLEEYVRPDSVLAVEWADRAFDYLRMLGDRAPLVLDLAYAGEGRTVVIRGPVG